MSQKTDDPGQERGSFSSPPCLMHELDPETLGFVPEPEAQTEIDVVRRRDAKRETLLIACAAMPDEERSRIDSSNAVNLETNIVEE